MNISPLQVIISDSGWDAPFFKKIALNDSGEGRGHQGGPALPKVLCTYLPTLNEGEITASTPTVERYLDITMYVGLQPVAESPVRYQFQTWGGTRPPEGRLTDGFAPLHKISCKHDILIFQRRIDSLNRFRVFLIRKDSAEYNQVEKLAAGRSWGALLSGHDPISQKQISEAHQEIDSLSKGSFQLINNDVKRLPTIQLRIARSVVFKENVRSEYNCTCAVTGVGIATPYDSYEVESAHIVPISLGGSDDVRNGVSLSQTIHWAFDRGLFGITSERRIYLPNKVRFMSRNAFLKTIEGKQVSEAKNTTARAHPDAFAWHLENRVKRWE